MMLMSEKEKKALIAYVVGWGGVWAVLIEHNQGFPFSVMC